MHMNSEKEAPVIWLERMTQYNLQYFSDVQLNMYGSSVSGFGLKGLSDLNIELTAERAPPVLKELYTILKADKSGRGLMNLLPL